jgi:hypothetical protein
MGIFKSTCPFPYGNSHMKKVIPYGKTSHLRIFNFYLNYQMATNFILEGVSD